MQSTTIRTATNIRRAGVTLAVAALGIAACGGSDDDSSGDDAAPAEVDADPAGDAADEAVPSPGDTEPEATTDTDAEPGTEPDTDGGDDSGSDDVVGAGSNDEAQQSLDDAGVDLDLDALEETATGFSTGDGGGTVTIDGVAYTFEAEICIAQGESFVAEGLAEGPDGTPAWASISYEGDGFDFDGDGQGDTTLDVYVEVGRTELFGSGGDDQPDWSATKLDSASMSMGEDITVEFDGNTVTGAGPISDFNGVAVPFGETAPMTFEATCS